MLALVLSLVLFALDVHAVSAGGSDTEIQFNNAGTLDGIPEFTFVASELVVNVPLNVRDGLKFKASTAPDYTVDDQSMWIDLPSNPTVRGSGQLDPDFGTFQGNLATYVFDVGAPKELFYTVHIPHEYDKENDLGLYFHVHTSTDVASPTGSFELYFEYIYALSDGTFSTTQTVSKVASFTSQYQHLIVEIDNPVLGGGAIEVDSLVYVRVYRDSTQGNNDDFTGDVFIFALDTHIQVNKLGTKFRNKGTGSFYV